MLAGKRTRARAAWLEAINCPTPITTGELTDRDRQLWQGKQQGTSSRAQQALAQAVLHEFACASQPHTSLISADTNQADLPKYLSAKKIWRPRYADSSGHSQDEYLDKWLKYRIPVLSQTSAPDRHCNGCCSLQSEMKQLPPFGQEYA